MFNSEMFLGAVNVNVINILGNSHYFVDKSGCSEKLKDNLVDSVGPQYFEYMNFQRLI